MKNTPEARRAFAQMADMAAHLNTGYRIEPCVSPDEERIRVYIYAPRDTEWAVFPNVRCNNPWCEDDPIRFEIETSCYSDHSLQQAQRVTTGLLAATNLVQNLYTIAEVARLNVE